MRIGLDIDGVLYPWHDSIYRHFQQFKGYEGGEVEFWDYFRALPESTQRYYVYIDIFYLDTMPRRSTLDVVPALADLGDIYYITSRAEHLERCTRKFFDMYDLPFKENLIFTEDKATVIRLKKIDYYLDDLPRFVDQARWITDAYLLTQPHNAGQREGYETVSSLKEFYVKIVEGE
jgi:uncharacterized HAD superfamily protein